MILTKHAETRIQQRCIPKLVLDLLIEHGAVEHQHGGTELIYFKEKNFQKARNQLERLLKEFDKLKDVYMIKSHQADEQIVVTTGYLTGSPRTKTHRQ
ncbi:hypothetical protein [Methylotuvimicrobium buryatense]|uniref:DUF4258 domain-containing protein n=1 Tax=Methylotuvimicrobium buryatense TaxID=95641 RepID=A0A4P9USQ6_METBY|nr:hypothetical protein [Methylotuvimicrobium buryatense]QCW84579.1 hypothetical protein EQU24_21800 [Methylotuvimicrobium buryatense]